MPNPWDNDPIVSPASGPVYGAPPKPDSPPPGYAPAGVPPKPLTPIPGGPADQPPSGYRFARDGKSLEPIPGGPADKSKDPDSEKLRLQKADARDSMDQLLQGVRKARSFVNDGWHTPVGNTATGFGYNVLSHAPVPTDASKLKATIDQEIRGNIFLKRLADLKAEADSPTGGTGVGRIMQAEIPLFTGALGSLDPGAYGTKETLNSLDQIERAALRSKARLNGENPDDPAVQKKYNIPALPTYGAAPPAAPPPANPGSPTGGNAPPTPRKLAPAEQQHFFDVLQHQGPDAADAYLRNFGLALKSKSDAAKPHSESIAYPNVHALGVGVGGVVKGVGDTLGIVGNPLNATINAATGSNLSTDLGTTLRDAFGLPAPQGNRENLINSVNEYGTQALSMAGAARAAAARIPGAIGSALETFGNHPVTDTASGATGGGASETARQRGAGPVGQMAAGLVGGASAAGIGTRVNNMARGASALSDVIAAGRQEGVTVPRAMADPALEPKVIATGKTMTGAKIMGRDMRNVGSQIEGRVAQLGDGGTPLEPYNVGDKAQGIGRRYIQQSSAEFNKQYGMLRDASAGVQVPANKSLSYVDDLLARLNKTPDTNAKEISYLTGVRSDLARGLDVESSRDLGSRLSRDIRKGDVTFGPMEKDVLGLRQAVSGDVADGLAAAGKPNVAAQFKKVDGAYQQRMSFVRNTIQKLTGTRDRPLAPEQAASRIQAWAGSKGDSAALGRIMEQATPEEKSDMAATFADSLGKDNKGGFSTAILANNTQRLSSRAKTILFGEDGAKSLDNLALLAKEHARVSHALGGSPTGLANDARSWIMRALFSGGTALAGAAEGGLSAGAISGGATAAGLMAAKIGKDAFSARALMSPKITGWLRSAPRTADPAAINAWYDRLKVIAVREPALAPDVQRIHEAFSRAANSNATPALAASQPNQANGNQQ